jgi:hypothetical protein
MNCLRSMSLSPLPRNTKSGESVKEAVQIQMAHPVANAAASLLLREISAILASAFHP